MGRLVHKAVHQVLVLTNEVFRSRRIVITSYNGVQPCIFGKCRFYAFHCVSVYANVRIQEEEYLSSCRFTPQIPGARRPERFSAVMTVAPYSRATAAELSVEQSSTTIHSKGVTDEFDSACKHSRRYSEEL